MSATTGPNGNDGSSGGNNGGSEGNSATTGSTSAQSVAVDSTGEQAGGPKQGRLARLYTGTGAFKVVGHRRVWYVLTAVLLLACVLAFVFRGIHLGIDFEGGTRVQLPVASATDTITQDEARQVFTEALGRAPESVQTVGTGNSATILLETETLDAGETFRLKEAIFNELQPLGADGQPSRDAISDSAVSGTWGGEVTKQALIALAVFLGLVGLFLSAYFEWRMAIAALLALLHDLAITAGIYSLAGLVVTPGTVIGLLTILGFSLYDTVVVFDKLRENTRGLLSLSRRSYPEAANLAVNQVLMRSINTSIIAVLPVLGLLAIGVGLLGVGTLKDLALVLMVGMLAGTYSSIFLAVPLVVDMKMRVGAYREQAERVRARRRGIAAKRGDATGQGEQAATAEDNAPTAGAASEGPVERAGGDEQRSDPALAGAASAPARRQPSRSRASGNRRAGRPTRPAGKSGRPSGKKRH